MTNYWRLRVIGTRPPPGSFVPVQQPSWLADAAGPGGPHLTTDSAQARRFATAVEAVSFMRRNHDHYRLLVVEYENVRRPAP